MHAMILAAGVGRRLAQLAGEAPKCLLRFEGRSLLRRHMDHLEDCGVRRLTVVVGYRAELIADELGRYDGRLEIDTVVNEAYRRGSILSLQTGLRHLPRSGDALVMDADVLYHRDVLRRLLDAPFASGFLLDARSQAGGEEMMLGVKDGLVGTITRNIGPGWDVIGEGVGFFKVGGDDVPALLEAVEARVSAGHLEADYESAIDRFLNERPAGYVRVDDLPWTEIDFDADVVRARNVILPAIRDVRPTVNRAAV